VLEIEVFFGGEFIRPCNKVLGASAIKIAAPRLVYWRLMFWNGGANLFALVEKY
jgi:hypothetical protein